MARKTINANVVFVIAQQGFRDEEYAYPREELMEAGATVITVSKQAGLCTGKLGLSATADIALRRAVNMRWDAVVFVGGPGASGYFEDPDAHELARKVARDGRVVAAICIAPTILGKAGLLDGMDVTSFPSEQGTLEGLGAKWTGNPVQVAQLGQAKVITGNGPEAARDFGKAIVDALS
jgi:protease I